VLTGVKNYQYETYDKAFSHIGNHNWFVLLLFTEGQTAFVSIKFTIYLRQAFADDMNIIIKVHTVI
jgi:hypothetical protein